MLKKILLGSVAGVAVVAGALSARADESQRFVFRYGAGVLHVAAAPADDGGGSESGGSGGEDGGTGETDPGGGEDGGRDGSGEPGDGEPTEPDDGEEVPLQGSVDGLSFTADVYLYNDRYADGYADKGDTVYVRTWLTNTTAETIENVQVNLSASFTGWAKAKSITIDSILPGQSKNHSLGAIYLSHEQVAALAGGEVFEGQASVTQVGKNSYPEGEHVAKVTMGSFGIHDPILPEHIIVSEPLAEHLDTDGDGDGDRGEVIRVTFKAENTGGLAATDVSFEMAFAGWPEATAYCDRATLWGGGSMACTADMELTKEFLATLGEAGTEVSLSGSISLVSFLNENFASGVHEAALDAISFKVPPPVYANILRIGASDGWAFECRTDWTPEYVDANREMYLTRWDDGEAVPAGGWVNPYSIGYLYTSWALLSVEFKTTSEATARPRYNPQNGDPRPFIPDGTPQPCISDYSLSGDMLVVSQGDHRDRYYVTIESIGVVRREI